MVEQLPNVHQFFASCLPVVAEQVIDVPKIILENFPSRRLCREPQLAEQLVEVPTILYFLKQKVDTPVPHGGRGSSGGLQGCLPGHGSSKRTANKIADIPASRKNKSATVFGEADHRFPAESVEQIVDNPAPGGGLQDLRPGQSSASSSHSPADLADDAFQVFSDSSPKQKKTRHYIRTRGRNCFRTRAHGRRGDVPMALQKKEEESEDEPDFDVEYVEFEGRWWVCEWVPARQQYCWWLAESDGLQAGHTTWRLPWLIGGVPR